MVCISQLEPLFIAHGLISSVGCGNGHLLFALLEEDYDANSMLGVDYSPSSVKLSEEIAASKAKQGLQGSDAIRWQVVDILDPAQVAALGQFDLILDKGVRSERCQNRD